MSDLKLMTISIFRFAERVVRNFFDHRMATYAAALAYRGLFALFPFMLIFVVLLGVFGPPDAFGRLVDEIKVQSSEQARSNWNRWSSRAESRSNRSKVWPDGPRERPMAS